MGFGAVRFSAVLGRLRLLPTGAKAFAEHLPGQLRELCLDFRDCRLPITGIRALAEHLPSGWWEMSEVQVKFFFFKDFGYATLSGSTEGEMLEPIIWKKR